MVAYSGEGKTGRTEFSGQSLAATKKSRASVVPPPSLEWLAIVLPSTVAFRPAISVVQLSTNGVCSSTISAVNRDMMSSEMDRGWHLNMPQSLPVSISLKTPVPLPLLAQNTSWIVQGS